MEMNPAPDQDPPDLPPGLCPNPIRASVPDPSRGLALVMATLCWAGLGAGCWVQTLNAKRSQLKPAAPPLAIRVQIAEEPAAERVIPVQTLARASTPEDSGGPLNLDLYSEDPRALPLPEAPRPSEFNLIYAPEAVANPANRAGQGATGPGFGGHGTGSGAMLASPPRPGEGEVVPMQEVGMDDFLPPKYPARAVDAHVSGDVVVRVTIDEKGRIVQHEIHAGHPAFHEEVDKVMPRWRFRPVRRNGVAIRATFEVLIRFTFI